MKRTLLCTLALLAWLGPACASPGEGSAPVLLGTTGGLVLTPTSATGAGGAGGQPPGSSSVGGTTTSGGEGGSGGGAGGQGGSGQGATGGAPPLCATAAAWAAGAVIAAASSPGGALLVALTPDERTLAWVEPLAVGGVVHYLDRADATAPFTDALEIVDGELDPTRGVALGPDGLRLVAVRADGAGFVELLRPTRADPFGEPSSLAFDEINALATLTEGLQFADPVLSPDGGTFLYSQFGSGAVPTVFESTRGALEQWPVGATVAGAMLQSVGGQRRRPTGVSADLRTLFYQDEVSGLLGAAFRAGPLQGFGFAKPLMAGRSAQVNAACDALYATARQGATFAVWVAAAGP